eukprot:scaffold149519_cov42-Prasinocladus_malaysianus.AAC.2
MSAGGGGRGSLGSGREGQLGSTGSTGGAVVVVCACDTIPSAFSKNDKSAMSSKLGAAGC